MDAMTNMTAKNMDTNMLHHGALTAMISDAVRASVPRKAWAFLAFALNLTEGGAKHKLYARREYTAGELALLLRSEHGLEILSAVMADSDAGWWRNFKRQMAISDARRHEREARRKLQEAVYATDDLTVAIARAETALVVSDPDFAGPHVDAMRAVARVPHRPVAPRGRR